MPHPQRKPWTELLDRTSFAKPASLQEAASRFRTNFNYFRINYLIVVLLCVAGSFLMHPSSLFVLAFLAGSWVYVFAIRQGPLVINGRDIRWGQAGVLGTAAAQVWVERRVECGPAAILRPAAAGPAAAESR
jgi:hypothetical protein